MKKKQSFYFSHCRLIKIEDEWTGSLNKKIGVKEDYFGPENIGILYLNYGIGRYR